MLNEKQLANRKNGVGASECAVAMNLVSYKSPYELWLEKTGRKEPEDLSNNPKVQWGIELEDTVARSYARITGCKVRRLTSTLYHDEYPHILCHIDRKLLGIRKILECKVASWFLKDNWGATGSDQIPLPYIVQVQHQLAVTGYDSADLAVFIGIEEPIRIYSIPRDEEIINKIVSDLNTFWNYVTTDTPPPPRDSNDICLMYPESNGEFKEADATILETIEQFKTLRSQIKELEMTKDKLKDDIAKVILDADGIKMHDAVIATWRANKNGSRVLNVR